MASSFQPVSEDREIAAMVPWRFFVKKLEGEGYETMTGASEPVEG